MKVCPCCKAEFKQIYPRQHYCQDCRLSGKAREFSLSQYSKTPKRRITANKYNRSIKGKEDKLKWYLKNRDKIMYDQVTKYRAETISRTNAHDKMKRYFPNKICSHCNSTSNINVHHKDKNVFNNELENLIYLCSSCHGKEHERLNQVFLR